MDIQELGAWGEFLGGIGGLVAALGVIATLIYLARQIFQNTKMVESSSLQAWAASQMTGRFELIGNPDLGRVIPDAMIDSRRLSNDTYVQVGLYIENLFRQHQMTYLLHRRGVIDADIFDVEMRIAARFLGWPGLRQWWDAGPKVMLPEFVTFIENLDPGEDANWSWGPDEGFISADHGNEHD